MKKLQLLLLVLSFAFSSCNQKNNSSSGDADFQKLSDEYITGYLAWRPLYAVRLGFHEYDGKLDDNSKASIDAELARLKAFDQKLSQIDTSSLSTKIYYDYRILKLAIKGEIFSIEDVGSYTKNPMNYAGGIDLNLYVKRNFAPIEERVRSIIAIEKQVPAYFENAKTNLDDSLAKPYIELAMDIAKGSASFLEKDMMVALKDVKNDSLMKELKEVNSKTVALLNDFASWLEKEKLPKAHNHYALGETNYRKMLAYNENIQISPDDILAIGMKELKKEQASFNAAAKIINPNKNPIDVFHDIQKEHPSADSLILHAKINLEAIRQFLVDKKIVTLPSEVRIQVDVTPAYLRSTTTASMDAPGAFEKKATEAYYYITPVDSTWNEKQKEDWLKYFDFYTTDNVTIHEAYPGHYTQYLHMQASDPSKVRKIFGSYAYSEGWAHYCEQMMADEGYGHSDPITTAKYRLAQSGDALLRICRLCVSINTHCHNMSVDEATKFFMDNWHQGEKPARQEAMRGTFDPGYLFYTVGKLEILKLREDYKKQEGKNFSLQKFHDELLDNGEPQIEIMREIMLKDKKLWNEIL
ncbi:MAG: hypothetical protein JWN78_2570 [Bacteroidota bacterium]|nr:hypothetical protein [Bacteroidota bacterium]